MKFTEHMRVFGIDSAPHMQLRAIKFQSCPDPTRKERARGEAAKEVIAEALVSDTIEWIDIVTPCGQEAVVEYIRRRDPSIMPEPVILEPVLIEEERKVKVEVEGR